MKIFACMAAILAEFPVVTKDQKNGGFGETYNYRGIDDALGASHRLLAKHSVFLALTDLVPEYHDAGTTKAGKALVRCVVTGKVRFYADDGSFVEVAFIGEGVDGSDKAMMKAQANGLKYVLFYTFCVPTLEKKDSEAYEDEDVKTPAPAPARTKKAGPALVGAPASILTEFQLGMSVQKSSTELQRYWTDVVRPEVTRMAADDPSRARLVDGYKKKLAELTA